MTSCRSEAPSSLRTRLGKGRRSDHGSADTHLLVYTQPCMKTHGKKCKHENRNISRKKKNRISSVVDECHRLLQPFMTHLHPWKRGEASAPPPAVETKAITP